MTGGGPRRPPLATAALFRSPAVFRHSLPKCDGPDVVPGSGGALNVPISQGPFKPRGAWHPRCNGKESRGAAMRSMRWNARGFTLIELMIVVAIIGVLASIAVPLYANVTARSRIAKAQADIRSLVTAVSMYQSHMSTYPIALRGGEPDRALAHAAQAMLGVEPVHLVPVPLDEVPGQLPRVDAHEQRAHDEGRVLGPDLAAHRSLERLREQLGPLEAGEGVEVALLLLRCRGRAEAAEELFVAVSVADVGEDGDQGGQHVGIDRAGIDQGRPIAPSGLGLDGGIVAQRAEGAEQVAAQLPRQLILSGAGIPAEVGHCRRDQPPGESFQA